MIINTTEKYNLVKRAIAVRQLEAFANMKEIMSEFNDLYQLDMKELQFHDHWHQHFQDTESLSDSPKKIDVQPSLTEDQLRAKSIVNQLLTDYLSKAFEGDLSFLTEPEFEQKLLKMPNNKDGYTSSVIKKYFQEYSRHSQAFTAFKKADAVLKTCAYKDEKDGPVKIDRKAVKKYHEFMQKEPGVLKDFDKHAIAAHIPEAIAIDTYERYNRATKKIVEIDKSPNQTTKFAKITPETFYPELDDSKLKISTKKLQDAASQKRTLGLNIHDNLYSNAYYAFDKITVRTTMSLAALGLVGLGALSAYGAYQANQFSEFGIEEAQAAGLNLNISPNTLNTLNSIKQDLDDLQASNNFPTSEQLINMRNQLDNSIDNVVGDLVSKAYQAKYPNRKVNSVETSFDENREPGKQNRIDIEYVDENGNIQTTVVTQFDTADFVTTLFKGLGNTYAQTVTGTFEAEKYFDLGSFNEALKKATDPNLPFTERTNAYQEIFQQFEAILQMQLGLAGKEAEVSDTFGFFPRISFVMPEMPEQETPTTGETSTTPTTSPQQNTTPDKDDDLIP